MEMRERGIRDTTFYKDKVKENFWLSRFAGNAHLSFW
jgi:hypothetical protein